jgi:hypothetical protein
MDAPTSSKQGHNSRTGKVVKSKIKLGVPFIVPNIMCINFKWFAEEELKLLSGNQMQVVQRNEYMLQMLS